MKLYQKLANELRDHIQQGYFQTGDKMPSVRQLASQHEVSISTVQEAYRHLEMESLVEARPKSGYFATPNSNNHSLPEVSRPPQRPMEVSQWEQVLTQLISRENKGNIQLQHAMPNMDSSSLKPLLKKLSDLTKHNISDSLSYGDVKGALVLREQLCRLALGFGCHLHPNDLVVTSGCQEALSVCLRAVAEAGEIIAIESPSFYGSIQAIKAANLKAIEIPTHPVTGLSLEALELALDQWPIKAILVTPTCNNPFGYTMPNENKQKLYKLAQSYDIAIIEDDIYGDISYQFPRPKTVKTFDEDGRVMFCSSFSKTIAPGLRVGWIAPGRYRDKVTHIKYVSNSMCPTLPQLAIADFIKTGGYDRHIRRSRQEYRQARDHFIQTLNKYFPVETKISLPEGGFILWVELPKHIDVVKLSEECQKHDINIAPGTLFSVTGKYRHCMRLNFSEKDMKIREDGIRKLAFLIKQQEASLEIEVH